MTWGTLFRQAAKLAQEGYSREEVREILRRAAELQAEAEKEGQDRIRPDALRAGASAAGIRPEFLERALEEFHAQKRSPKHPKAERQNKWGKFWGWAIGGIIALPVLLLVAGTLAFTFSVVITVLIAVGLALGIAGLVLLFLSPVAGVGLLVGLAALVGHLIGRFSAHPKRKHRRRWWGDWDDDDD